MTTCEPSDFLWRFYATVSAAAQLRDNAERDKVVRSYLEAEQVIAQQELDAFLRDHYNLSDQELAERVRRAPDMGGSALAELNGFMRWGDTG